jgi:hypothetical protein
MKVTEWRPCKPGEVPRFLRSVWNGWHDKQNHGLRSTSKLRSDNKYSLAMKRFLGLTKDTGIDGSF